MTIFIVKGDTPLSTRKANERGERYFNSQLKQWEREAGILTKNAEYLAWASGWLADNLVNANNNLFNSDLRNYRKAIARLSQYRLADGRAEVIEQVDTGDLNDDFEPVTEAVVTTAAIEPLEAQIEQAVTNEEGEQAGTEMVANPLIVQDDAERAIAQETIDAIPQDVIDFYDAQQAAQ